MSNNRKLGIGIIVISSLLLIHAIFYHNPNWYWGILSISSGIALLFLED